MLFSSDGSHLYAATEGEGVYRLDLGGHPPEGAASPPTEPASSPQDEPAPPAEPDSPPDETPEEPTSDLPCLGGLAPLAFAGAILIWQRRS